MANAPELGYFVDGTGDTVQIPLAQARAAELSGYLPASPKQIEEFEKVRKFSTTGQRVKTFGEGAAQALTFGLSTPIERSLGVEAEDIKSREEANPVEHLAGTLTGVAVPLLLTAGGAGAVEGAAAATEGASGLLGVARAASSLSAPSLIAKAGEGAAHALKGVLPEATTALGRIGAKAAVGAASAGTEGALYGAGHVVHEAALGDPNLTWQSAAEEVGLSGLLGAGVGAAGGVLGGLTREASGSGLARKLEGWARTFEGRENIKMAGAIQSDISREARKIGLDGVNELGRAGGDLGLVDAFSTPAKTLERSEALMESAGQKMGAILEDAESKGAAPKAFEDVMGRVRKDVLSKMDESPFQEATAEKLADVLGRYEERFAGRGEEAGLSFKSLHSLRKDISDELYGLKGNMDPGANYYKSALHDVRTIVSDEITKGLDAAGLDSKAWQAANREYQVGATFAKFAEKGIARSQGNNLIPLTSLLSGGAGLIAGGPLGGAALGAASFLAKKYGPGVLAVGARGLRNLVDEGSAEALVNKTADLIASERSAGRAATAEAAAAGSGLLTRAFDVASERLEPAIAPVKDATRHALHERVGMVEKNASREPETVAALSQLEKARRTVEERVDALAGSVVSGHALEKSEAAELSAHLAAAREKDSRGALFRVRELANNPELMQEHITARTQELVEHAPGIAQAAAVHMSRSVSYLNQKFPPPPKLGPMGPVLKQPKSEVLQFHKTKAVIEKPSLLLKHAAAGSLTPALVAAVQATAPERLAQMQTAVLEKVAAHPESVPYKSRLMLSMLFSQSMDGTTTPQAIQAAQLAYQLPSAKAPENQLGGGVKTSQTGLSRLNLSGQARLPGQAAESRRREA